LTNFGKNIFNLTRYNAKRATLVQSRIKALNKMDAIEEILEDPTCVFMFPTPDKL
jgi:ATP-binding cassette subfamily F protein 3